MGQRRALPFAAGGEQERAHRGRHPHADGVHGGAQELHRVVDRHPRGDEAAGRVDVQVRSEEHTSELQSQSNLVCRLLLEKKKRTTTHWTAAVHGRTSTIRSQKICSSSVARL